MRKLFVTTALLLLCAITYGSEPFSGKWYASQYGCSTVVEFLKGGMMSISSEANSGSDMTVPYHAEKSGSDYTFSIDLGMENLGMAFMDGDDHMRIAVAIGAGTPIKRPKKYEDALAYQANLMLDLYRNPSKVSSVLDRHFDIPKESKLAFERNKRLGRGINLNGFADGNRSDGNDAPISEEEFRSIAQKGFDSVRIPIKWTNHCMPAAPYTIDPAFFKKIDNAIEMCFKYGLAVSIDVHYYPYINMTDKDKR